MWGSDALFPNDWEDLIVFVYAEIAVNVQKISFIIVDVFVMLVFSGYVNTVKVQWNVFVYKLFLIYQH